MLHYGVQDQQFRFKLVGKAEEQMGLAFSYDVSPSDRSLTEVSVLQFQDSPQDGFIVLAGPDQQTVVDLTLGGGTGQH